MMASEIYLSNRGTMESEGERELQIVSPSAFKHLEEIRKETRNVSMIPPFCIRDPKTS